MSEKTETRKWGWATTAIHGPGRRPKAHHAVSTPIVQTSNYYFDSSAEVREFMAAKAEGRLIREAEYGRYGNPTQEETERKLAALDGAERAVLFSSGMSAVIVTLLTYVRPEEHVVFTSDCYRQTRDFAARFLERVHVPYSFAEPSVEAIEAAIRPDTRVIFTESPTNPYLRCLDIPRIAEVARRHDCMTIVDSTLATPYNLRPLEMGIDIVIQSATKYLGGHNDLLAGVATGSKARMDEVFAMNKMIGAMPGAMGSFLLERGLKTFAMRMEVHNRNGLTVARFLEGHPKIEKVWYPGLPSHPDHAVAMQQMRGHGSVISFLVRGGNEETVRFIDSLDLFLITPSLGGTESLVTQMALMSFFDYPEEERQRIGMVDNLVRIALGCEDVEDLISDLEQALARV